jgi:hypothetical protein
MPPESPSESVDRPPKRMRIGTRSCAECRRRKVRCVFAPNTRTCEECATHETLCTAQQPCRLGKAHVDKGQEANLQQRLEDLEGIVRHMCKAIDLNVESLSLAEFKTSEMEALKRLQLASTPGTRAEEDALTARTDYVNPSESEALNTSSDQIDRFEDAPLLSLFKDAMLIQTNGVQVDRDRLELSANQRIKTCIAALNALIPRLDDLTVILELTKKYWPLWPVSPKGPASGSDRSQPGGVTSARNFILDSLRSGSHTAVAKAVLWLALCIQQLPGDFKYQRTNLPALPSALLDSYLGGAESLLSIDEDLGGTIEGLECLTLQTKLYINMGKPRKAWLSIRRSMNFALLLGLHHLEDSTGECQKALWSQAWQSDRQLSLILGFPYAIADSHPGLSRKHIGQSIAARAMYELSIIAGHIIERNQNHRSVNYSVTVQIDQEFEQCRDGIPLDWWDAIPSPSMPLEALYGLQSVKLHYYHLYKLLHLPYMLKSSTDRKFENSRISTLEASREMIKCYQTLRNSSGPAIIICDLMDFQVFSGAIVIVINLLSQSYTRDVHQEAEDWKLIHGITRTFKHISREMECTVPGQAAQLLEYLSIARHGTYSGPEGYEAVIPYFGKVRISQLGRAASQTDSTPPTDLQIHTPQTFSNSIEFSANSFIPFSQGFTADYLSGAELGVDWTPVLGVDTNYDWNQLFNNAGSWDL